ncbi:MAG TPA: hypothetical protein VM935_19185, partial [Chitinophagaceae bacterium]|nr:hypothetical protein [Chitinophagaceae bacterium]
RDVVDRMLVILPFEKAFFENKWNYKVDFVGHPLVQVVNEFKASHSPQVSAKPLVALLPGSRKQEIAKKLPVMLEASRSFPDHEFVIAKAASLEDEFYEPFLTGYNAGSVKNDTYGLLSKATAALVTSGTATLETALFGVPQVVCYKGSSISYQIAKRLVKIKYISLVNLIMDREVVKELIQEELTTDNVIAELGKLLYDQERRQQMLDDYATLKESLQAHGDASKKAAGIVVSFARSNVSQATLQ